MAAVGSVLTLWTTAPALEGTASAFLQKHLSFPADVVDRMCLFCLSELLFVYFDLYDFTVSGLRLTTHCDCLAELRHLMFLVAFNL